MKNKIGMRDIDFMHFTLGMEFILLVTIVTNTISDFTTVKLALSILIAVMVAVTYAICRRLRIGRVLSETIMENLLDDIKKRQAELHEQLNTKRGRKPAAKKTVAKKTTAKKVPAKKPAVKKTTKVTTKKGK